MIKDKKLLELELGIFLRSMFFLTVEEYEINKGQKIPEKFRKQIGHLTQEEANGKRI